MSEKLIIATEKEADHIERSILRRERRTAKEWRGTEQDLSRYVFAEMPNKLALRAIDFAIEYFYDPAPSSVAKIVTNRVMKEPVLLLESSVSKFFERCLGRLMGRYGYLGYDVYGDYCTMDDWYIARRVLLLLIQTHSILFMDQIERIHLKFLSGYITVYPVGSAESSLVHAEIEGALEFVLRELPRG